MDVNGPTIPFPEHSRHQSPLSLRPLISTAADASFPPRSPQSLLASHQRRLPETILHIFHSVTHLDPIPLSHNALHLDGEQNSASLS
ncbi:hypothetical protein EYF80_003271 [Liparis tanakae]|uniref:Uncharacterized protein n=1 Tax=Liparis tanakae TaxID=230148 RepID=A0A4Z2J9A5_9TELE|nr:hypothetical protein EYF80_003271 [Liparis tanakae]